MSLQRRLLGYLLFVAPVLWAFALWFAVDRSRHEVNELFDTELIRLARQVHISLPADGSNTDSNLSSAIREGEADLSDLALAVWNQRGERRLVDREGALLPFVPNAAGFRDIELSGEPWRVYYLQSSDGQHIVAAGQRAYERTELIGNLLLGQALPWLLALPLLVVAIVWSVRQAMTPVRALTDEIDRRDPGDAHPLETSKVPAELRPVIEAMNNLIIRTSAALERERRFTSDAAHELRTPLAALAMQWERLQRGLTPDERARSKLAIEAGFERLNRLVSQLLALARADAGTTLTHTPIDWRLLFREAIEDCLVVADRREIEFEFGAPDNEAQGFQIDGDEAMLGALARNLLDNAARYGRRGSTVKITIERTQLRIRNEGPKLPDSIRSRMGERFVRPEGQAETGSGLGISIACQIAAAHGLVLSIENSSDPEGVIVTLSKATEVDTTA